MSSTAQDGLFLCAVTLVAFFPFGLRLVSWGFAVAVITLVGVVVFGGHKPLVRGTQGKTRK